MWFTRKKRTSDRFHIGKSLNGKITITFFTNDPPWGYIPSVGDYVNVGDEKWRVELRHFDIRVTGLRLEPVK